MAEERIQNVELVIVESDPDQPRKHMTPEKTRGLSVSMNNFGQQYPIRAHMTAEGKARIIDGHRRFEAAKLLGWKTIKVILHEREPSPEERKILQLISNAQREDLRPIEGAKTFEQILNQMGWKQSEAAAKLGFDPARITRSLGLLSLSSEIQTWVDAGKIPASSAYELSRIEDKALQSELALKLADGKLTRDGVVAAAKRAHRSNAVAEAPAPRYGRVKLMLSHGRSVILAGERLNTIDSLLECLEEILGKIRKARPHVVEIQTLAKMLSDQVKSAANSRPSASVPSVDGGAA